MQLIENLHRADLSYIEEAEAYKRMKEELGYNYDEIALRVGKSEKHIGRYIKLLTLPDEILQKIDKGDLTLSKALFLCSLNQKIMEDIISSKTHWFSPSYTLSEFKEAILRSFMINLSNTHIHFDLKKKYIDDDFQEWPACTKCYSKKQMTLFEDFNNEEQCPYAPCFRAKQLIQYQQQQDKQQYSCNQCVNNDAENVQGRNRTRFEKSGAEAVDGIARYACLQRT